MRRNTWFIALPLVVASIGTAGIAAADPIVRVSERVQVVIPAAPAARVEVIPVRPSAQHTWVNGYWHWHPTERRHVWVSGYWMPHFTTVAPPAVRFEQPGPSPSAQHFWVRGYWKWNGRNYEWIGGHWDTVRAGHTYVHPHWDVVNGRYVFVEGHFQRA